MKKAMFVRACGVLALGLFVGTAGCGGIADINDIVNCPSKRDVEPWAACAGRRQCAGNPHRAVPRATGRRYNPEKLPVRRGHLKCPNAYACEPAPVSGGDDGSTDEGSTDDSSIDGGSDAASE